MRGQRRLQLNEARRDDGNERRLAPAAREVFAGLAEIAFAAARLQFDDNMKVRLTAIECLRRAREAQMLLIDDIGKERATSSGEVTETVGDALHSLIEFRVSNKLPTIWTCNMDAAGLERRLGADRGGPTLRRLRDVSYLPRI